MLNTQQLLQNFLGNTGGGAGGLNQLLQQGQNMLQGGQLPQAAAGLLQQAQQHLGSQSGQGFLGGAAAGTLASLLLGTKTGRNLGEAALKLGGVAAVGGLAYWAWQNWQKNQTTSNAPLTPPPAESAFAVPTSQASANALAELLLQAMIMAAKADGHIDAVEQQRIMGQLQQQGNDPAMQQFMLNALTKPVDATALAAQVTSPGQAAEVYLASLLVIATPDQAEQRYLQQLAQALQLPPALVTQLQASVQQFAPLALPPR